jgi:hypothetical protein
MPQEGAMPANKKEFVAAKGGVTVAKNREENIFISLE